MLLLPFPVPVEKRAFSLLHKREEYSQMSSGLVLFLGELTQKKECTNTYSPGMVGCSIHIKGCSCKDFASVEVRVGVIFLFFVGWHSLEGCEDKILFHV